MRSSSRGARGSRFQLGWLGWIACFAFCCSVSARALEAPALIPDDVGLCIDCDHLFDVSQRFLDSEFYVRLEQVPELKKLVDAFIRKPQKTGMFLASALNMTNQEFGNAMFHGRTMMGVWPGDFSNIEESRMLLIAETRDADFARQMVAALRANLDKSRRTDFELSSQNHAGRDYVLGRGTRGKQRFEVVLAQLDALVILSSSDSIMRRSLELASEPPDADGSVGNMPTYRAAMARLRTDAQVSVFVNPGPWTTLVDEQLAKLSGEPVDHFIRGIVGDAWKAADYWVSSANLEPNLSIESFMHFDSERLTDRLRTVGQTFGGASNFLRRVPPDAVIALSNHIDLRALVAMFLDVNNEQIDDARDLASNLFLGLDPIDDVLAHLGPDVGVYFVPSSPAGPPGELERVTGLQIRQPKIENGEPTVAQALDGALRTGLELGAVANDDVGGVDGEAAESSPPEITIETIDDVRVTTVTGFESLPEGDTLSYSVLPDYLLIGTSRDRVVKQANRQPSDEFLQQSRFRELLSARIGEPSHVLYFDGPALRSFLSSHEAELAKLLSRVRGQGNHEARSNLQVITDLAALGETILVAASLSDQGLAVSIGVSTDRAE